LTLRDRVQWRISRKARLIISGPFTLRFLDLTIQLTLEDIPVRTFIAFAIMALFLAYPAWGDNQFKEGGKEVGQGFKKMGEETGRVVKEGSKEVGRRFKEAGKETGEAAKNTGRGIGAWFRDLGQRTGDAFREMGRSIRRFFTGG
jgi:hypothetical protein